VLARPGLAGRLRLQAAISLLRLATAPQYDKYVIQHLHLLAWAFQDQAFQVRGALIHKLVAYTLNRRITNTRYTTILFITAHDPDYENILMAQRSIMSKAGKLNPGMSAWTDTSVDTDTVAHSRTTPQSL
jgi:sister-chromatid-cohesion protein PDS5